MLFIVATLGVGFAFSTMARSQMQSMQMTMFYFLPNILLSGFMFPFRGMPVWAQWIGEALPLTHFLRIVRGVMLKGAGVGRHCAAGRADPRLHRRRGGGGDEALSADARLRRGAHGVRVLSLRYGSWSGVSCFRLRRSRWRWRRWRRGLRIGGRHAGIHCAARRPAADRRRLVAPVSRREAWVVLTDFDAMSRYVPNLDESRMLSRERRAALRVEQRGVARWGLLTHPIRDGARHRTPADGPGALPQRQRLDAGRDVGDAVHDCAGGTEIRHHIEIGIDTWMPDVLIEPFLRYEVQEQFEAVVAEMLRRRQCANSR